MARSSSEKRTSFPSNNWKRITSFQRPSRTLSACFNALGRGRRRVTADPYAQVSTLLFCAFLPFGDPRHIFLLEQVQRVQSGEEETP